YVDSQPHEQLRANPLLAPRAIRQHHFSDQASRGGVGVPIERRAPAECSASMRGEAGETLNFRPILTAQRMERRMLLIAIVGVAEIRNRPMAKCEVISRTP